MNYARANCVTPYIGEFKGAFAICEVGALEIVDANHSRTRLTEVDGSTQLFVRYRGEATAGTPIVNVETIDGQSRPVTTATSVPLQRVGASSVFEAPIVVQPAAVNPVAPASLLSTSSGPVFESAYTRSTLLAALANSSQSAQQPLRTRASLRLRWANDNGQESPVQVTRIQRVQDPSAPGAYLYAEVTKLIVMATDNQGAPVAVPGLIRVDETENISFPPVSSSFTTGNWRYSYQRDAGVATDLRPTRTLTSQDVDGASLGTVGAPLVVTLVSLAGSRSKDPATRDNEASWFANLFVCDSALPQPCDIASSSDDFRPGVLSVRQWVDQVKHKKPLGSGGLSVANLNPNGVADWMEAAAWDVIASTEARGGLYADVASSISAFEMMGTGGAAAASTTGGVTTFFPAAWPRAGRTDALRWDSRLCDYIAELGYRVDLGAAFSAATLHEARHAWVRSQPDPDEDGFVVGIIGRDPSATRIEDDENVWVGGLNTEVHASGENTVDDQHRLSGFDPAQERDAEGFGARVLTTTSKPSSIEPSITGAFLLYPGTKSVPVGSSADQVAVVVEGDSRSCDVTGPPSPADIVRVPGILVRFEVLGVAGSSPSGVELLPQDTLGRNPFSNAVVGARAVAPGGWDFATPNNLGIARVYLRGVTPGTYVVRALVNQLTVSGAAGPVLAQLDTEVNVFVVPTSAREKE